MYGLDIIDIKIIKMIGESEKMKIILKDDSVRNYERPISVI